MTPKPVQNFLAMAPRLPIVTETTVYNVRDDMLHNRCRTSAQSWQTQFNRLAVHNPALVVAAQIGFLGVDALVPESEQAAIDDKYAAADAIQYTVAHITQLLISASLDAALQLAPADRQSALHYGLDYPIPTAQPAVIQRFNADHPAYEELVMSQTEQLGQHNPHLGHAVDRLHQDQAKGSRFAGHYALAAMEYALAYTYGVLSAQVEVDWLTDKFNAS